jgi:hypothetical protein
MQAIDKTVIEESGADSPFPSEIRAAMIPSLKRITALEFLDHPNGTSTKQDTWMT